MSKKALLINPPSGMYIRDDRCQVPVKGLSSGLRTPLDLAYMAAILEKENFKCVIRDYPAEGRDWQDYRGEIESGNFDMLVISVTTPTLYADLTACGIAKEINSHILTVAKGAHFSAEDTEVMEQFPALDVIIRGEYELTIQELGRGLPMAEIVGITWRDNGIVNPVREPRPFIPLDSKHLTESAWKPVDHRLKSVDFSNGVKKNPDRPFLEDMDILPLPARHLLDNGLYIRPDTGEMMTSIQTNRGCPARCVYCLVGTVSGNRIRARSPEAIADEMEICKSRFGIKNFYFRADTFTWDKDWMIDVCKRIIAKNLGLRWVCNSRVDTIDEERLGWLKKAGCWMIGFGIESGDAGILKKMKKGITTEQALRAVELSGEFGIKTYLFWVLGLPWETEETIKNTMRFAKKIRGDFAEFHIAYPFPGTDFYRIGIENSLFSKEDLYKGDVKSGIVRTFTLSAERLQYYQRKITRVYYLSPRRIARLIKGVRSPLELLNYIKKACLVLFNSRG